MPRRGTLTEIPGLSRDGTRWILRATYAAPNSKRRFDKQKMIDGATEKPTRAELRALERMLDDMKAELKELAERDLSGMPTHETLGDFAPRWLEHTAMTGRTRKHVNEKRVHDLERFVLPDLGKTELSRLKRSDLVKWMETVAKMRQQNGQLYRKATLHSAWATFRAMLKRGVIMRDLPSDPTAGLRFELGDHVGGEPRPERVEKESLTLGELQRLLDATKHETDDIGTMIVVQVSTGMRFCEVSSLEWQDIDLDAGKLRIVRSQVGGVVGPPKTEVTRRDVFLAPVVVELLRRHRQWQRLNPPPRVKDVGCLQRDVVFPSQKGTYRQPAILRKPLMRCCKLAGIEKAITSHALRRTANDLLRRANGDTVTRAMIGHATSEMTRLYSSVDHDEKAKAHANAFKDVLDVGLHVGVARSQGNSG